MPCVDAAHAIVIALYLLRVGFTLRDVAELHRAHPRVVAALIAT
jgi:hypothetical protein